ncbi:MAG: dethiobiotin synthase [Phycisphaerae bacterium]|nr:dethiobiotin synthase [Phycisphaerae bacterium]
MKAAFITGTDTGVGKTIVCGLLARYLLDLGRNVITQKWIQTGSAGLSPDIEEHLSLMGKKKEDIEKYLPDIAPYVFRYPASAHLAAALEGKSVDAVKIKNSFTTLSKEFDTVIVEGIGGALVPFNNKELVIDIAKELDIPVIIVAKNKLGTVNHTLLTVEALKARNMKIKGIIFNDCENEDKTITDDNPVIIKALTGERILGQLPWLKEKTSLQKAFKPIGDNILSVFSKGFTNG